METNPEEQTTMSPEELQSLLVRVKQGQLSDADLSLIEKLILLDIKLISLLKKKKTTLKQIREFVFGSKKTEPAKGGEEGEAKPAEAEAEAEKEKKPRASGHGRNAAADYTGANHVLCTEEELKIGGA